MGFLNIKYVVPKPKTVISDTKWMDAAINTEIASHIHFFLSRKYIPKKTKPKPTDCLINVVENINVAGIKKAYMYFDCRP